jgi:glycosyltransferase involved in cell wall biosynthesis
MGLIVKSIPSAILLIAGKDNQRKELGLDDEDIYKLNLQDNVIFLGEFTSIPLLLSLADVYVLPSLSEGFSLTTIEAMAMEKPVVVTDCGGPSEMVINGENGLIVPVEDPEKMSEAIMEILADKSLQEILGLTGRKRAKAFFGMDKFIKEHEKLYQSLV